MKKVISIFGIMFLLFLGCISTNEGSTFSTANETNITNEVETNYTNTTNETVNISTNETIIISENITLNETTNTTLENNTGNEEIELEGITFGNEKYIIVLDDLSLDKPESCALVSIYDYETQERLQQAKICPGEEYYWTSPEGHKFRIVVLETGPGYGYGTTWASIIIYG